MCLHKSASLVSHQCGQRTAPQRTCSGVLSCNRPRQARARTLPLAHRGLQVCSALVQGIKKRMCVSLVVVLSSAAPLTLNECLLVHRFGTGVDLISVFCFRVVQHSCIIADVFHFHLIEQSSDIKGDLILFSFGLFLTAAPSDTNGVKPSSDGTTGPVSSGADAANGCTVVAGGAIAEEGDAGGDHDVENR